MIGHPEFWHQNCIAFGPFRLTIGARLLTRDGHPVELGGRALDLLIALLEVPGEVVPKAKLIERVWRGAIAEEGSLRVHMTRLRTALNDGENGARYITTQAGVGYAFVAPVYQLAGPAAPQINSAGQDNTISKSKAELPYRHGRLVGRERDANALITGLATVRLFTLVGAPGVGKTVLAIEVAHRIHGDFDGLVEFVDLSTVKDQANVPVAISTTLGLSPEAGDPLSAVLAHLRNKRAVLVIDNCEHVIEPAALAIEQILKAAPLVAVLATSREPLRARDEHIHWLEPLEYPSSNDALTVDELRGFPAVELFVDRATAADSRLQITDEDILVIAGICRRLGGMALPIELAAGRVAAYGLSTTASLLGEHLSLGWTGRRTAPPRHQTLRSTLDWSYDLLSDAERRSIERLSVFLGPFSIDAARRVIADHTVTPAMAQTCLEELTTKSLITRDRSTSGLYRLLDFVRDYASGKLLSRGDDEASNAVRRHAEYFASTLNAATGFAAHGAYTSARELMGQLGNIRAALEWSFGPHGDLAIAVPLAAGAARAFLMLSLLAECRDWCARALKSIEGALLGGELELELQGSLGLAMMHTRGNSAAAETALRRALEIAERMEDRRSQLRILGSLHIVQLHARDYGMALTWANRALDVANSVDDPEALSMAHAIVGAAHLMRGEHKVARPHFETALLRGPTSENKWTIHHGINHYNRSGLGLARTLFLLGYPDQANKIADETVSSALDMGHALTYCVALTWSLSVYIWAGNLGKAETNLERCTRCAEENGFESYLVAARGIRGELAVRRGMPQLGIGLLKDSLARLRAARYELLTAPFSAALAEGLLLAGQHEEALSLVGVTIDECNRASELILVPELMRIRAKALLSTDGRQAEAEEVLMNACAISQQQGSLAWELRATIDLARLLMSSGRHHEALDLLETVRNRFPPNSNTVDICAADQLLRTHRGAGISAIR